MSNMKKLTDNKNNNILSTKQINKNCEKCAFRLEGVNGVWCSTDLYDCKSYKLSRVYMLKYEVVEKKVAVKA
jgi:hypothetical protein